MVGICRQFVLLRGVHCIVLVLSLVLVPPGALVSSALLFAGAGALVLVIPAKDLPPGELPSGALVSSVLLFAGAGSLVLVSLPSKGAGAGAGALMPCTYAMQCSQSCAAPPLRSPAPWRRYGHGGNPHAECLRLYPYVVNFCSFEVPNFFTVQNTSKT